MAILKMTLCLEVAKALAWYVLAFPLCYMAASAWESIFHEMILDHPVFRSSPGFTRGGPLSELWFAHFSHNVVHHHLTYRTSYISQFQSPEHCRLLTEKLTEKLDPAQARSVLASRFGLRFTWTGARQFALPLIILCTGIVALCPGTITRLALLISVVMGTTPYLVFSRQFHAHLHQPFMEVETLNPFLGIVLRSPYGLVMRIGHYVHHRNPTSNFNLQLGYDLIMGKWRRPTRHDWDAMVEIGLVTPLHRMEMEGRRILFHPL